MADALRSGRSEGSLIWVQIPASALQKPQAGLGLLRSMGSMMNTRQRWQIWRSPYFWLVAVALLALPLLADFNVRLAYSRQITTEEAQLQHQISAEQKRQAALKDLAQYVKSDAYVEHWARMARLTKPGEVAVVPVSTDLDRKGDVNQSVVRPVNEIRSEWWMVLFDRAPVP